MNSAVVQDKNVIVGGDFNSLTPGSIDYLEREFGKSGLARISSGTGPTFNYRGLQLTLDHLFSSPFEIFGSGVWRDTGISDHYPVWAEIRLQ